MSKKNEIIIFNKIDIVETNEINAKINFFKDSFFLLNLEQVEGDYIEFGVFDGTLSEKSYGDLTEAGKKGINIKPNESGGWIGLTDKYWLTALLPDQDEKYNFTYRKLNSKIISGIIMMPDKTLWLNFLFLKLCSFAHSKDLLKGFSIYQHHH